MTARLLTPRLCSARGIVRAAARSARFRIGSLRLSGCLRLNGALHRAGGGPLGSLRGCPHEADTARFKGATFALMATAEIGAG